MTPSYSATQSHSLSPSSSQSGTPTASLTSTSPLTRSPTQSPTQSVTQSITVTPTMTPTPSQSASPGSSASPSSSPAPYALVLAAASGQAGRPNLTLSDSLPPEVPFTALLSRCPGVDAQRIATLSCAARAVDGGSARTSIFLSLSDASSYVSCDSSAVGAPAAVQLATRVTAVAAFRSPGGGGVISCALVVSGSRTAPAHASPASSHSAAAHAPAGLRGWLEHGKRERRRHGAADSLATVGRRHPRTSRWLHVV